MNGSDNLSSAVVLPDENHSANSCSGMGEGNISNLISIVKSNGNNPGIVYDPDSALCDVLPGANIISLPDKNTGGRG